MKWKNERSGWIRLLLGVLTAAAFATAVVPVISSGKLDLLRDKAREQCERIAAAVSQFVDDTGRWPTLAASPEQAAWLHGSGEIPGSVDSPSMRLVPLSLYLEDGDARMCGPFWEGPYLMGISPDPWGSAYVVSTRISRGDRGPALVMSAGPDRVIDTPAGEAMPRGDDIGVMVP